MTQQSSVDSNYISVNLDHALEAQSTVDSNYISVKIDHAIAAVDIKTNLAERTAWYDTRLFHDEVLYCEGGMKPTWRGRIHLIWISMYPFAVWRMWVASKGNLFSFLVGHVDVFTNLLCFSTSAIFHTGTWSMRQEIVLQKIDHCAIST